VHGNVWEWAEDCWNASHLGHAGSSTPRLQGDCSQRVRRGGAWFGIPTSVRAAHRAFAGINERKNELGFRVVRNISN
jgi:formylglycine-generating enzyme required for sulfatase activity